MTSTKEEIQKAAMSAFRTVEVNIGSAKATLRELSSPEREALDARLFKKGPDGEFLKNDKGNLVLNKPGHFSAEWIAATITPEHTAEEVVGWYESTKDALLAKAQEVNGILSAEETAKNS